MIKNIVFDCSDTLLHLGDIELLESMTGNAKRAHEIHDTLFKSEAWNLFDKGQLQDDVLEKELLSLLDPGEQEIGKCFLKEWINTYTVIEGIPELISKLKDDGYRVYVLSDFPHLFEVLWNKFDLFRSFDGRGVSYKAGVKKSETKLFEYFLEKYSLKADECVFVDDHLFNVNIAKGLGMTGFVFTDVCTLKKDLESIK